jgi:hypothetical protein
VRADDHVDFAGGEIGERLFLLRVAAEAAHHVDANRKSGKPLLQGLLMLKCQHGGRRQKRDLRRVHHRLEGRSHGDFRLAVPDVAAKQTVHRRRQFHVALDIGDRRLLIRRQLVLEGVLEFLLPVGVWRERAARHRLARGVELQQLLRHVAHRLFHPTLRALP